MEIKINIDLESALSNALTPEKLNPILDKHISDAITAAIRDATDYKSEFRKSLTTQLTQAFPHGLAISDVAKFQNILNQTLTNIVHSTNAESVNVALAAAAHEVIPDVPETIKLSELIKAAREGFHKQDGEGFYAYLQESDYGTYRLYLNEDKVKDGHEYKASHQLTFLKDGKVYSMKMNGEQITPASRPSVIGRFDSILMCMYVGRTRIEVDIDEDEVRYASEEKYD